MAATLNTTLHLVRPEKPGQYSEAELDRLHSWWVESRNSPVQQRHDSNNLEVLFLLVQMARRKTFDAHEICEIFEWPELARGADVAPTLPQ